MTVPSDRDGAPGHRADPTPTAGPTEVRVSGLDGRVALVTGAGRGIGRRIADLLAAQGGRVAATDIEAPSPPPGGLGLALDVRDPGAVDGTCTRIEEAFGTIDILVLNAGILRAGPFAHLDPATWDEVIDVNLTGAYRCARRVVPSMATAGWGRVVAVGSSAGKTGGSVPAAAYAASKAGMMTLVRSVASEYARDGVTANSVAPSYIDTEMLDGFRDVGVVPVGRLGTPDDVAFAVLVLCSDHASYITGEIVNVGGGSLID